MREKNTLYVKRSPEGLDTLVLNGDEGMTRLCNIISVEHRFLVKQGVGEISGGFSGVKILRETDARADGILKLGVFPGKKNDEIPRMSVSVEGMRSAFASIPITRLPLLRECPQVTVTPELEAMVQERTEVLEKTAERHETETPGM